MPNATSRRLHAALPFLAAGAVILSMWAAIASGLLPGRMASDQLRFHEVVIRLFREQWPDLNLRDYRSATTPGYHLFIAACSALLGDARPVLQHAGSIFSGALLVLLAWALHVRAARTGAHALCAPAMVLAFGTSLYVWPAGVWLLPDNAGWLFVLGALLLALTRRPLGRPRLWPLGAGLVVLALVSMRQIHLWVAAPLFAAAWLSPRAPDLPPSPAHPIAREFARLRSLPAARAARALLLALCLAPAFLLVAWFARLWGGLTPPLFQASSQSGADLAAGYGGVNLAAPALVLALLTLYTPFFAASLPLGPAIQKHRLILLVGGCAGLALALLAPTTYDKDAGRWTGLWNLTRTFPTVGGRTSLLLALLSTAGGVCVALWALALPRRAGWVLLAALVGFTAALCASHQLWQRYAEPLVLLLLMLAALHGPDGDAGREGQSRFPASPTVRMARTWSWLGPLLLATGFAALTANALRTSPRQDPSVMGETLASERARLLERPR